MKKSLRLICLGFVFLFMCTGMGLMYRFPVDTQPFVEKKYTGWNGVLQVWICTNWNAGGNFIQWLNRCASRFEKTHEGVYLEFTPVQKVAMHEMNSNGLCLPDLVLFSPGVITNPDILTNIPSSPFIRSDLKNYGQGKALPVALGGYIWAYNSALCNSVPHTVADYQASVLPEYTTGQSYSAALLGLLSGTIDTDDTDTPLPDSGIDLGLPVTNAEDNSYTVDALEQFINGKIPCIPVDAQDIARLSRLTENGKGPEWKTKASGDIAFTDQILLASIPEQEKEMERRLFAEEFISFLLQPETQAELADIGAFSVTGENIHDSFSVYAEMDTLINSRQLWLPACFSEYSDASSETIVRRFLKGEISAKNALRLLRFEGM